MTFKEIESSIESLSEWTQAGDYKANRDRLLLFLLLHIARSLDSMDSRFNNEDRA
jgi:hypothetical protein